MNVTSRISATGAASLSRGPQPVTAGPAELSLSNLAVLQPSVALAGPDFGDEMQALRDYLLPGEEPSSPPT